jgi:hypothetical protein
MDSLGRDLISFLLINIDFRTGRQLSEVNKQFRQKCNEEHLWERWYFEEFGLLSEKQSKVAETWIQRFKKMWNWKSLARKVVKKYKYNKNEWWLIEKNAFYIRHPGRACGFMKGLYDDTMIQHGDIIIDPDGNPRCRKSLWHEDFQRLLHLDYGIVREGAIPSEFETPRIPLDYYGNLILIGIVHISMNKTDRNNLEFHFYDSGNIEQYYDPRFPDTSFGIHATLENFDRLIANDVLCVQAIKIGNCHYALFNPSDR